MEEIFNTGVQNAYARGEFVPLDDQVNFIKNGSIAMYVKSKKGRRLLIVFRTGDIFPYQRVDESVFANQRLELVALETSFVLSVSRDHFELAVKQPEYIDAYIGNLIQRLNVMFQRVDSLMAGSAQQKIILRLVGFAEQLGRVHDDKVIVDVALSHADIAAAVGTTRETVNRTMRDLEQKNVITQKRQTLVINSLSKLEQLVEA